MATVQRRECLRDDFVFLLGFAFFLFLFNMISIV